MNGGAGHELRARRARTARRLLTRRNAEVFGPTRVSARARPDQAFGARLR
jgi:hypothetical protein